jgi:hypothetical protein
MQCVGAIIVSPLLSKYSIRSVLSLAVLCFAFVSMILLIVDARTGGHFGSSGKRGECFVLGPWEVKLISLSSRMESRCWRMFIQMISSDIQDIIRADNFSFSLFTHLPV